MSIFAMNCPNCHNVNKVAAKFCKFCGYKFAPPSKFQKTRWLDARQLNKKTIVYGRSSSCDQTLSDPTVSSQHAKLEALPQGGHRIVDFGSANGTWVNGNRIKSHILKTGDRIQIGPFRWVYHAQGVQVGLVPAQTQRMRLDVVNLNKSVGNTSNPKVILDDISLTVKPGEFVALIGGSGAGKSTLLDAMNGMRPASKGHVLINGDDLYQNYDMVKGDIGYVPQADILHMDLTVTRALRYAAKLRLPHDTPSSEIETKITEVLQAVDMVAERDKKISVLSGGQKKRVSIAAELMADPALFFLDEPTSGLDPGLDKTTMHLLRKLANEGRTIILTTHTINNIDSCCDLIAFMSRGQLVYFGAANQIRSHFKTQEYADIYSQVSTDAAAKQARQQYLASPHHQNSVVQRQRNVVRPQQSQVRKSLVHKLALRKSAMGAHFRQLSLLSRRYIDLIVSDKFTLIVLTLAMPIISLFILLTAAPNSFVGDSIDQVREIAWDTGVYAIVGDTQKLLFLCSLATFLLGLFASSYEIIKEKQIYLRERLANVAIIPYVSSKLLTLGLFGLLQTAVLLAILMLKVKFPEDGVMLGAVVEIFLTLFLTLLAGIGTGLFISAIVQNRNSVIYLILLVLFVQIVFSGALFELPDTLSWLSALTVIRWSMEGVGATVDMEFLNSLSRQYFSQFDKMIEFPLEFNLNYEATVGHLMFTWVILGSFTALSYMSTSVWLARH